MSNVIDLPHALVGRLIVSKNGDRVTLHFTDEAEMNRAKSTLQGRGFDIEEDHFGVPVHLTAAQAVRTASIMCRDVA